MAIMNWTTKRIQIMNLIINHYGEKSFTVDDLAELRVKKDMPRMSRSTIDKNLDIFADKGYLQLTFNSRKSYELRKSAEEIKDEILKHIGMV